MGGALIRGWLADGAEPHSIAIVDPRPGEDALVAIEAGARTGVQALETASTVLISVKPQIFAEVADDIESRIARSALIISIMAGTSVAELQRAFPGRAVVRAMPNTPSAVGAGITGLFASEGVREAQVDEATALLHVSGPVLRMESERDIDRVTAVSGSGPAYVFHMVEALAEAGEAIGLSEAQSSQLARETIIGAAALLAGGEDACDLRRAVTSPNGTTQAALEVLMAELPDVMARTVRAAVDRAVELGDGELGES
jgi:pyrroline-5-carboxylate reductase